MDWLKELIALQAIAQAGLSFPGDKYDKQRFQELRDRVATMMAHLAELPQATVKELFCNETGFQTPKVDTRAFIYKDNHVLLVKEGDRWSLPGGWCEVTLSPAENTIKEALEEAGANVSPTRLLLLHDYSKHQVPAVAYGIIKCFFLCTYLSGDFKANIETSRAEWFALDALPPLWENRNSVAQIRRCAELANDPFAKTEFDI